MKNKQLKKLLSVIFCMVLIAALALSVIGCGSKKNDEKETPLVSTKETEKADPAQTEKSADAVTDEVTELGQGEKQFDFVVVDKEGKETKFLIKTNKTTVGEALLELNLIAGETSTYGLYVKTVNGQTVDYDKDGGYYWAFYIDGEYAMTGVDSTNIENGKIYSFKVTK